MADPKLVELLKQGSDVWNEWRKQQPDNLQYDLRGADLHSAYLCRANLRRADLRGANLRGANLYHANLRGANLNSVYLIDADLRGADLNSADLGGVNLIGTNLLSVNMYHTNLRSANLRSADLRGADLRGADLHKTIVAFTTFAQIDLSDVKGLAELIHQDLSYVELHTTKLPQDGRALHFLRGAGVPDEWIDFYRIHIMHPIQYHSCFISYSSQDGTLARRLYADLQAQGVRCWFAPEDMKIGDKIHSRIDEAIHLQDKLLLLLSEYALQSSWVEVEVLSALEKENHQGREVLFPVRLDESVMQTTQAWAKQLRRSRHIGDFTCWTDPQAYQQAFERLLRDLKAQE